MNLLFIFRLKKKKEQDFCLGLVHLLLPKSIELIRAQHAVAGSCHGVHGGPL